MSLSSSALSIQNDAPLVAIEGQEQATELAVVTEALTAPVPPDIAAARFDLDDVGTEVGQQHRARRAGHCIGEVDDP